MKKIILLLALFVIPVVNAWGDDSGALVFRSANCREKPLWGSDIINSDEYLYVSRDAYRDRQAYECGANGCDMGNQAGLMPGHVFQGITVDKYKVYECTEKSWMLFKDQMWVDITETYKTYCEKSHGQWDEKEACQCEASRGLAVYNDGTECFCRDGTEWNAEQDRCVEIQSQSSGDDEQEEKQSQGSEDSDTGSQTPEQRCTLSGGIWKDAKCDCSKVIGAEVKGDICVCKDDEKKVNVYKNPDIAICLAESGTDVWKRRNFNMPEPTADVLNCIKERTGHMEGQLCCRIKDKATFIGDPKSGVCVWNEKGKNNSYRVVVPYEEGYFWEGGYGQKFASDSPEFTSVKNRLAGIDGAEKILCEIGRTDLMQNPKNCNNGTYTGSGTGENGNGTGSDNGTDPQNSESGSNSGSENTSDTEKLKKDFATSVAKLESIAGQIKTTVWKDTEGNFNTSRLISDSVAGVVLGTAGGLITSSVVKKSQVKNGFEDINCTVGGQVVSGWGDQFNVGIQ